MGSDIDTLVVHERKYIVAVLQHMDGNRSAAAKVLGISLRGLQYILARWRRDGHEVPESLHSKARKAKGRLRNERKRA